jgi:hypothetical protein
VSDERRGSSERPGSDEPRPRARMSDTVRRMSREIQAIDALPDRPMDKDAPLVTPEEAAAYEALIKKRDELITVRLEAPPSPREWNLPGWAQAVCLVVLGALLLWPTPWWPEAAHPTQFDVVQGTRLRVWLVAQEVERERALTGAPPPSLAALDKGDWSVDYTVGRGGLYTVSRRAGPIAVSYASTERLTSLLDGIPRTIRSAPE